MVKTVQVVRVTIDEYRDYWVTQEEIDFERLKTDKEFRKETLSYIKARYKKVIGNELINTDVCVSVTKYTGIKCKNIMELTDDLARDMDKHIPCSKKEREYYKV